MFKWITALIIFATLGALGVFLTAKDTHSLYVETIDPLIHPADIGSGNKSHEEFMKREHPELMGLDENKSVIDALVISAISQDKVGDPVKLMKKDEKCYFYGVITERVGSNKVMTYSLIVDRETCFGEDGEITEKVVDLYVNLGSLVLPISVREILQLTNN